MRAISLETLSRRPRRAVYANAVALVIGMLAIGTLGAMGATLDTDRDGMTDEYEDLYGLDKLNPADALQDPDLDGFSSLSEFQAGTNPLDRLSTPPSKQEYVPDPTIAAAVLPLSRSAQLASANVYSIDSTVTAFASIVSAYGVIGAFGAYDCSIAPITPIPAEFFFYATDPTTNAIVGARNAPADTLANGSISFVFGLTPHEQIDSREIALRFACGGYYGEVATVVSGVNTLVLSASNVPTPDIIAVATTASDDGVLRIPDITNPGAFAVATINLGASGAVTARATTSVAGVTLTLCETDLTAQCINPAVPAASVDTTINANATPTFSVFATAQQAVPLKAADNRISVTFTDAGNVVRGATGVAIEALATPPKLSELQASIFTPICASCHGGATPPAGLSLVAGSSFGNLVNVTSVEIATLKRVLPGNANNSYLVWKLDGGHGIAIGAPPLPPAQIEKVRDWISAGALNN
jgi:hypothetical protein